MPIPGLPTRSIFGISLSFYFEKQNAIAYKEDLKNQSLKRILKNIEVDLNDYSFNIEAHNMAIKSADWLYEKSQLETNDSIRHQYYREMDSIIISEAPIVPLYYDQVIRLVQNNITGLNRNPMNLLTLKTVKKENI